MPCMQESEICNKAITEQQTSQHTGVVLLQATTGGVDPYRTWRSHLDLNSNALTPLTLHFHPSCCI